MGAGVAALTGAERSLRRLAADSRTPAGRSHRADHRGLGHGLVFRESVGLLGQGGTGQEWGPRRAPLRRDPHEHRPAGGCRRRHAPDLPRLRGVKPITAARTSLRGASSTVRAPHRLHVGVVDALGLPEPLAPGRQRCARSRSSCGPRGRDGPGPSRRRGGRLGDRPFVPREYDSIPSGFADASRGKLRISLWRAARSRLLGYESAATHVRHPHRRQDYPVSTCDAGRALQTAPDGLLVRAKRARADVLRRDTTAPAH
jgi:hypothetical protein